MITIPQNLEEIVTYEVNSRNNIYYLKVPVNGLENPKFLLKEEEQSLYIFLFNYKSCYVIKEIDPDTIGSIKKGRRYLVEGLLAEGNTEHMIDLIPNNIV